MQHAIALVPGFLGFDHHGETSYFADRFIAGLRGNLEAKCEASILVSTVSTLPIGSLAARQPRLIADLRGLEQAYGGPFVWHLVGHSTGGLDAALLARTEGLVFENGRSRFSGKPIGAADPAAPAALRLASVTTLAAPHYGTSLSQVPLVKMSRGDGVTRAALLDLLEGVKAAAQRDALRDRIEFALGSAREGDTPRFLAHLLFGDELAGDLDPAVAGDLTGTKNRRKQGERDEVAIFSIATVAPPPPDDLPDRLFHLLWTWTKNGAEAESMNSPDLPALDDIPVIAKDRGDVPSPIGRGDSDGVVDTDRQVDLGGTFAGLVLADHGDVVGRYRRTDPLRDGEMIDPGLLTSGARFDDESFFRLLDLVARGIAGVVRASGQP
jgi:pimeloyl-ACP methyl ester carboxylesterase